MSLNDTRKRTLKMVELAFLCALVVVLQLVSYYVRVSTVPVSLVLIPITIGGMIAGVGGGTFLGAVFGIVCLVTSFTGIDTAGFYLLSINAFEAVLIIVVKGVAAGLVSALVYKLLRRAGLSAVPSSAICAAVTPLVNTGLFLGGMYLFFADTLSQWAGGSTAIVTVLTTVVGINFVVEFLTTVVLTPILVSTLSRNRNFKNMF